MATKPTKVRQDAPTPVGGGNDTFIFDGREYNKDTFTTFYVENYMSDPFIREQYANLFYLTDYFYGVDIGPTGASRTMWERIGDWAMEQAKKQPAGKKFTLDATNMNQGITWALSDKNKTLMADFGGYLSKSSRSQDDKTTEFKTEKQALVELKRFAYDNGIVLSESAAGKLARILSTPQDQLTKEDILFIRGGDKVLEGLAEDIGFDRAKNAVTLDSVKQYLRNKYVLPKYQAWSDEIKAGFDMREIANDYIQMVSQELEMDPEQIDLNDPLLQNALKPKAGSKSGTYDYLSYGDFTKIVRSDKRWWNTNNAKDKISSTALGIKKMFGF